MTDVAIEQFGGFVGAGAPGGSIHTRGKVAWSDFSRADQAQLDALFAARKPVNANLYYRLTRSGPNGTETVDAPSDAVPAVLVASLRTTLD